MKIAKLLILVCTLPAAAFTSQAKEWRGIVPLHSTRADVERLIGKPNAEYERYDFEGEQAVIFYARHPCSEGAQWNVPPDTVTSISVYPKKALLLAALRLDLGAYKRVGDSYSQGRTVYWNEKEGIQYHVSEGERGDDAKVREIYYQPAARDAHLRCRAKDTSEGGQKSSERGPGGDACPDIYIVGSPSNQCPGQRCSFSAALAGLDHTFSPTFKWVASAGTITSGQGTQAIEIDTSKAGDKPITVTLKVGGVIPDGCPNTESYTLIPAKASSTVNRRASCRVKRKKGLPQSSKSKPRFVD